MELRRVEVWRKREEQVFVGCWSAVGVRGCRGEGEVVEDEFLDLVEAGAGELGGGVAGVVGEGVELGGLGVVGEADGVGFVDSVLLDGEVEGAGVVRGEGEGDVDGVGLVEAGLKACSFAAPKAELGPGSSLTVSTQAVPVALRRTCWSLPAISGSVEASFQSLPGVSWRRRVGPEKGSKPQKPVTVPEMVVASAGATLLAGLSAVVGLVWSFPSFFSSSEEFEKDSRGGACGRAGGRGRGRPERRRG